MIEQIAHCAEDQWPEPKPDEVQDQEVHGGSGGPTGRRHQPLYRRENQALPTRVEDGGERQNKEAGDRIGKQHRNQENRSARDRRHRGHAHISAPIALGGAIGDPPAEQMAETESAKLSFPNVRKNAVTTAKNAISIDGVKHECSALSVAVPIKPAYYRGTDLGTGMAGHAEKTKQRAYAAGGEEREAGTAR